MVVSPTSPSASGTAQILSSRAAEELRQASHTPEPLTDTLASDIRAAAASSPSSSSSSTVEVSAVVEVLPGFGAEGEEDEEEDTSDEFYAKLHARYEGEDR